jgi:hypothetical protein
LFGANKGPAPVHRGVGDAYVDNRSPVVTGLSIFYSPWPASLLVDAGA